MQFPLFIILASLSFSYAGNLKGIEDEWSFDLGDVQYPDWMSCMGNNVPLSALTIPGTHNSMIFSLASSWTRTQNELLASQLLGGIRYFDISCRYTNDDIMVYNGLVNTGYSLKDVLYTMFNFLDDHPREVLILRIQKGGILGDSKKFLDFVERHFDPDSEMGDRVAKHIYFSNAGDTSIPTIGEARGKVLILQDFKSSQPALYGIPWNSDTVSSYSHSLALGSLFLGLKWDGIESHFSQSRSEDFNKLRITHTTAGAGVKPIDIAAKNHPGFGMNRRLGRYLLFNLGDCFGIIAMDFPGYSLVKELILRNYRYRAPEPLDFPSFCATLPMPEKAVDDIIQDEMDDDNEITSYDEINPGDEIASYEEINPGDEIASYDEINPGDEIASYDEINPGDEAPPAEDSADEARDDEGAANLIR